jgi:hypothetical protein
MIIIFNFITLSKTGLALIYSDRKIINFSYFQKTEHILSSIKIELNYGRTVFANPCNGLIYKIRINQQKL